MSSLALFVVELPSLLAIPALTYSCFCFWMFCACVYREEDRDDRLSWAIMLLLFSWLASPCYYWRRYRPMRAARLREEAAAAAARAAEIESALRGGP